MVRFLVERAFLEWTSSVEEMGFVEKKVFEGTRVFEGEKKAFLIIVKVGFVRERDLYRVNGFIKEIGL